MSKDYVLHKVWTALGRHAGDPPAPEPPPWIRIPEMSVEERIASFRTRLEELAGKFHLAESPAGAAAYVRSVMDGRRAVASSSPFLRECGIVSLPGVRAGVKDRAELRDLCATHPVGITSADYALADTGSLVMIAGAEEPRLVSLLPPVHIAVVPRARLLTGLDELLSLHPLPVELSSSMVLITGPSRTADIEQILVRGVHGPGEIHVVIVADQPK